MKLNEILGQDHLDPLMKIVLQSPPRGILIYGPMGCGKTSLARALAREMGEFSYGDYVPDDPGGPKGSATVLESETFNREDWGRLIGLLDGPKDHVFIIITPDLDKTPKAIQSRCLRLIVKPLSNSKMREWGERFLTLQKIPYTEETLSTLVSMANGDMRQFKLLLGVCIPHGSLDFSFLESIPETALQVSRRILLLLSEGYFPEAQKAAEDFSLRGSCRTLAMSLLSAFSEAWGSSPREGFLKIRGRWPDIGKTTRALMAFSQESGESVGPLIVQALNTAGTPMEDPRVLEEKRSKEKKRLQESLKGISEINLDLNDLSNRSNPEIPLHEDKSVSMDPRVREKLRLDYESKKNDSLKESYRIPSTLISEDMASDTNPLGLLIQSPKKIPKGVLLGTQFAKRCRAKVVDPHEVWDLLYKIRGDKKSLREHLEHLQERGKIQILSEDETGVNVRCSSLVYDKLKG